MPIPAPWNSLSLLCRADSRAGEVPPIVPLARPATDMDPKRWQQIDKLLEEALDREPEQRAAFLEQACAGDEELRRKAEALLAAHEQAGDFVEVPALDLAARAMGEQPGRSLVGRRLGPYEILSLLGRGGMGEVYRAQDTRLDHIDALKILPAEVAADPDRSRRFVREAKAASALNHPNIATIYEIGESDGIHWIAMELVEGETLAERLKGRSLEVPEVLDLGIQVAEALEKAHSKGIIHRDIKPANVILTPEGQAKVLDFGLAKVTRLEGQAASATVSTETHTVPGMVMGTARYMSPEQVLGQAVDHRTDIFSLGVVLYEMATGQPPFAGETASAIFDAILHQPPPWPPRVHRTIPEELRRIIQKSLEKFREMRYQTASDLGADLKRLKRDMEVERLAVAGAVVETPRQPGAAIQTSRKRWAWTLAGLLALVSAGVGITWYVMRRTTPPTETILTAVPLTSYPGTEDEPSFSPDGSQVAFTWNGEKEDNFDIYVKVIGTEPPLRLTSNLAKEYSPAWSPDGRWIVFCRDLPAGKVAIVLISPIGGPERILTERLSPDHNYRSPLLAWSPDTESLVIVSKDKAEERPASLFLFSLETREARKLTSPPAISVGDSCPAFSPDGHSLAFCRWAAWADSDLYRLDLSQSFKPIGEPERLTSGKWEARNPVWTIDGRAIVFSSWASTNASLWKIDAFGLGKPQRLATTGQICRSPSISRRGNRLAYVQWTSDSNIWCTEIPSLRGNALAHRKLIASTYSDSWPQFSPDGKRIAFLSNRSGSWEIWVSDSEGANPVQLTFLGKGVPAYGFVWSPDSSRLTFYWDGEGHSEVYVVNANGGRPQRLTTTPSENPHGSRNPSWSRDGRWILFDSAEKNGAQVCKVPAEGGPVVKVTHINGYSPFESPDGKSIYYLTDTQTYCKIPAEGGKEQKLFDYAHIGDVGWPVNDGIYFIPRPERGSDYSIQFLNTATGKIQRIATFVHPVFGPTVSPDRRRILYTQIEQAGSDLMLVEDFR